MILSFPVNTDFVQGLQAEDVDGNIINLTSATALRFKVWPFPREGATVALILTVSSGIVVDNATLGEFTITITHGTLVKGTYFFEVGVTLSTGVELMIGRGDLYVTESNL